MSDTSYDCYYEKHFALHSLSGVKHCAFEMLSHTFQQISGMFLVCSQFTPYCLSRVVLDSREFSSIMLPMCSDIFIRSTIYLLGVWRNRRSYIYISTLCQYLNILTVTKFTEMNRVVGRSVCTLLRDAALGRNLPYNLKSWPLSTEKC